MSRPKKLPLWEYRFERLASRQHATNFSNSIGQQGWEMVAVVQRRSDKERNEVLVAFKRIVEAGAQPSSTPGLSVERRAKAVGATDATSNV